MKKLLNILIWGMLPLISIADSAEKGRIIVRKAGTKPSTRVIIESDVNSAMSCLEQIVG